MWLCERKGVDVGGGGVGVMSGRWQIWEFFPSAHKAKEAVVWRSHLQNTYSLYPGLLPPSWGAQPADYYTGGYSATAPPPSLPSFTRTYTDNGPLPSTDLLFSSGMIWNHILQWCKHNWRGEDKGRTAFGAGFFFLSLGTKAVSSTPRPITASHGLLTPDPPHPTPKPCPTPNQKNGRRMRHTDTHSKTYSALSLDRPAKHKTSLTLQSNSPPLQQCHPSALSLKWSWWIVNSTVCVFNPGPPPPAAISCPHDCLTFRLSTLVQDSCCLCVCVLWWAGRGASRGRDKG